MDLNWRKPRSFCPVQRSRISSARRRARSFQTGSSGRRCIMGRMVSVVSSLECSTSVTREVKPSCRCGCWKMPLEIRSCAALTTGSSKAISTGVHQRHISTSSPQPPPNWPSGSCRSATHQWITSASFSRPSRCRLAHSGASGSAAGGFGHGIGSPRYIRTTRFSGKARWVSSNRRRPSP